MPEKQFGFKQDKIADFNKDICVYIDIQTLDSLWFIPSDTVVQDQYFGNTHVEVSQLIRTEPTNQCVKSNFSYPEPSECCDRTVWGSIPAKQVAIIFLPHPTNWICPPVDLNFTDMYQHCESYNKKEEIIIFSFCLKISQ